MTEVFPLPLTFTLSTSPVTGVIRVPERLEAGEGARLHLGDHVVERDVLGLFGGALEELDLAVGNLLADGEAEGDADEVRDLELDAGALVPVVEEHVEACAAQLLVEALAGVRDHLLLDVGDG